MRGDGAGGDPAREHGTGHGMRNSLGRAFEEVRDAFGLGVRKESDHTFRARHRLAFTWESVPILAEAQDARERGGEPQRYSNLYDYAIRRWGSRLPDRPLSVLMIGCTLRPDVASLLLETKRVASIVVVDSDAVHLENLVDRDLPGVECWQMDLNKDPLPRGPFDLVVCRNTLIHLRELEHVADGIRKVMDPGGLLIAREYVGPNRLQFTDAQMELVNACLGLLPESMRRNSDGEVVERQEPPGLDDMMRLDPTRAIRSEDIPGVLAARFRILESMSLGGTLLAPLLASISENFRDPDAEGERVLRTLMDTEMRLIEGGLLETNYAAIIARQV